MVRRLNLLIALCGHRRACPRGRNARMPRLDAGTCDRSQQLGDCRTSGTSDGSGVTVVGTIDSEHPIGSGSGENRAPPGRSTR